MIEKLRVIAEAWGIPFEELLHALVVEDSNDDGSSKFGSDDEYFLELDLDFVLEVGLPIDMDVIFNQKLNQKLE